MREPEYLIRARRELAELGERCMVMGAGPDPSRDRLLAEYRELHIALAEAERIERESERRL